MKLKELFPRGFWEWAVFLITAGLICVGVIVWWQNKSFLLTGKKLLAVVLITYILAYFHLHIRDIRKKRS